MGDGEFYTKEKVTIPNSSHIPDSWLREPVISYMKTFYWIIAIMQVLTVLYKANFTYIFFSFFLKIQLRCFGADDMQCTI